MRVATLAAAAALVAVLTPGLALGADGKVAVALDDEMRKAVEDALLDRKMTLAQAAEISIDDVGVLASDPKEAAARARDLFSRGKADALVVGSERIVDEKQAETGASARVEVTLDGWSGRSGERILHVVREEKGSAAKKDRALEKARKAALEAAAKQLAEQLSTALSTPAELTLKLEIYGLSVEARSVHQAALDRALAKAGLTVATKRHEKGAEDGDSVLVIEVRSKDGSIDDAEMKLRAALDQEGLKFIASQPGPSADVLAYLYKGSREVEVRIDGVSDEAQEANGPAIAAAFEKLPGVSSVERRFVKEGKDGSLILRVKVLGSLAALDAAVAAARDGALGALRLTELTDDGLAYRLRGPVEWYGVEIGGIEAGKTSDLGAKVDDALASLPNKLDYSRSQDATLGKLELRILYKGREHDLDRALLAALAKVEGLALSPTAPGPKLLLPDGRGKVFEQLAYKVERSEARAVRLTVDQLTPEVYASAGTKLVETIGGLDGVRILDRKYERETGRLELAVEVSGGDAVALDSRIWKAARAIPELSRLAPSESRASGIGYVFLPEKPSDFAVKLVVENLAPEAYGTDGQMLVQTVRDLEGAKDVQGDFDKKNRRLTVSLRYKAPAHEFEDALWTALKSRSVTTPFSPDRRDGNIVQVAFIERRSDRSRVFVRLEAAGSAEARAAAKRLVARLKSVEGVTDVIESGDRIELWSKLTAAALYDVVARAIGHETDLEPLVDGGLDGNVIRVRGDGEKRGKGGERRTSGLSGPSGEISGLADLIARVEPTVVSVETMRADEAWMSSGSGFFISPRGYVLTAHHVIGKSEDLKSGATRVRIKTADGRALAAFFIKGEKDLDLALLQVRGDGFPNAEIGRSEDVRPGDAVVLIGNPLGLERSVTTGIVSGTVRANGWIQTSASVNSGNSGGPAFGADGRVIGVVIASAAERGVNLATGEDVAVRSAGISYIVPIHLAEPWFRIGGVPEDR